jgi:tetratricopeptide (TPR) repeat protein
MPTPFLSSEEYDERAHQLYNEALYDEALDVLREGLALYPNSVELHIGVGYARLAREEFAWARRSFEEALVLEPEHEDALAGLGETLLKFGQQDAAIRCFRRILELGYNDDVELMLQVGRAAFREASHRERTELFELAMDFFNQAVEQAPEMAEPRACLGYTRHRMSDDAGAIEALRAALKIDSDHAEARIYLANILYDRTEYEGALYHFERTNPEDHWDELGIWRMIELKRSIYKLEEHDGELTEWNARLSELAEDLDELDDLLAELEAGGEPEAGERKPTPEQYEIFGALLGTLAERGEGPTPSGHQVVSQDGRAYEGSWEEILTRIRDADREAQEQRAVQSGAEPGSTTLQEYMKRAARRALTQLGVQLPSNDAESFLRASASAGLLRILR